MTDTRENILNTALRLFARDGYEAVCVNGGTAAETAFSVSVVLHMAGEQQVRMPCLGSISGIFNYAAQIQVRNGNDLLHVIRSQSNVIHSLHRGIPLKFIKNNVPGKCIQIIDEDYAIYFLLRLWYTAISEQHICSVHARGFLKFIGFFE